MKFRNLLVVSLSALMFTACSSGKSGDGSGIPRNQEFVASEKILGGFESDQDLNEHSSDAEAKLAEWRLECENKVSSFDSASLRVGLKVTSREDEIYLWPNLEANPDVRNYESSIEKVISPSEFVSIIEQSDESKSLRGRHRNTTKDRGLYSQLIEIVSTNPPEFKKQIEDLMKNPTDSDDNYVQCKFDFPEDYKSKRTTSYATLVLKSGQKINGIRVSDYYEVTNYSCGLYRKDKSLVREVKLADRAAQERIDFYSKEFVNPFNSSCHADSSLLSVDTVKDISGNRGLIKLWKDEVLSISN